LGIKLVDGIEETAALGDRFSRDSGFGVIESLHAPAVSGHFTNGVPSFCQQLPKSFNIVDAAWKAAPDPDNGDTFFMHINKKRAAAD
jgi:hypothetical protein